MAPLYLFLIGMFTSALCGLFVYFSIHEMKRLNPGPFRTGEAV